MAAFKIDHEIYTIVIVGRKKVGKGSGLAIQQLCWYSIEMARPLRIEYAGALYHLISRGDRREDIYLDDQPIGSDSIGSKSCIDQLRSPPKAGFTNNSVTQLWNM